MISKVLRRSHMYLALFLSPWLLMYTLSTLAMNHRDIFIAKYGRGPVPFHQERVQEFDAAVPEGASAKEQARMILMALDLDGAHNVNQRPDGTLMINRNDLTQPRRITYRPGGRQLVIEKAEPRANALLERFHRRRGYATGYALDNAWAMTVDLFVIAMVAWVLTGIWMWWEMKPVRRSGALAVAGGNALFALFVFTI